MTQEWNHLAEDQARVKSLRDKYSFRYEGGLNMSSQSNETGSSMNEAASLIGTLHVPLPLSKMRQANHVQKLARTIQRFCFRAFNRILRVSLLPQFEFNQRLWEEVQRQTLLEERIKKLEERVARLEHGIK